VTALRQPTVPGGLTGVKPSSWRPGFLPTMCCWAGVLRWCSGLPHRRSSGSPHGSSSCLPHRWPSCLPHRWSGALHWHHLMVPVLRYLGTWLPPWMRSAGLRQLLANGLRQLLAKRLRPRCF
jgi:hypothetical protein